MNYVESTKNRCVLCILLATPMLTMKQLEIVEFTSRSQKKISSNDIFSCTHAHAINHGLSVMASSISIERHYEK